MVPIIKIIGINQRRDPIAADADCPTEKGAKFRMIHRVDVLCVIFVDTTVYHIFRKLSRVFIFPSFSE